MYREGRGTPQNAQEAFNWMSQSAQQHYPPAQYSLGQMYSNGRGVQKNDTQALHWYTQAAENGEKDAQYNLGMMYLNAEGTAKICLLPKMATTRCRCR